MKKLICLVILCLMFAFSGCVSFFSSTDYGYHFHYRVDGGNGDIELKKSIGFQPEKHLCDKKSGCELNCPKNSYYFSRLGSKLGNSTLTFIAIPESGYQVKEWYFNGEIVEGNRTNEYTATVTHKENYNGVISVVFELVS